MQRRLMLFTIVLMACQNPTGGEPTPTAQSNATPEQTPQEQSPTPSQGAIDSITYFEHIRPLLERSCVRCHSQAGVGPGDYTTYEGTAPVAELIAAYVTSGFMPPPASDPLCHDYRGSEKMTLTDAERQRFGQWAKGGALRGDESLAEENYGAPPELEGVNLEVRLPKPYRPEFDASGNQYVCFAIENPLDKDAYVAAYDALLDKGEMVHHMAVYADLDADALKTFGNEPFPCFFEDPNPAVNRIRLDWRIIGGWVPGQIPVDYRPDAGHALPKEAAIVFEMHYFDANEGAELLQDQSGARFVIADEVDRLVQWRTASSYDFKIPAGAANHVEPVEAEYPNAELYPDGLGIIASHPHMHLLGTYSKLWIDHADGSQSCITDGPYDFKNQLYYQFDEPVLWQPGDKIRGECHWNNSTSNPNLYYHPPIDITYGDGTDDEMCILYFMTVEEN